MSTPITESRTWVVISDLQVPYQNQAAVASVLDFIKTNRTRIHGLLCVGDEIDAPQPSRWERGRAGEHAQTLVRDITATRDLMREFRSALGPGKPFHMARSNHGDRILRYVESNAPALVEMVAPGGRLDMPTLLEYDHPKTDITYHRNPFEFEPGWVLCHGDEGSMNQTPGGTAKGLAVRWGMSVVCGHTHRAGLIPHTTGVSGNLRTIFGLEVGCLMDVDQAGYLKAGHANWQHAIGIVTVEKAGRKTVITPSLRFVVDGRVQGGPLPAPIKKNNPSRKAAA